MEEPTEMNPFFHIRVRWLFIVWIVGTISLGAALEYSSLEQESRIFLLSIASSAIVGVGVWIMARRQGLRPWLLLGRLPQWKDMRAIPLIVPLKIASLVFLVIVASIFQLNSDEFQSAPAWTSNLQIFFYVLSSVIIAPFIEEFFFRGILLHRFAARWGIPAAIVFSSMLFGILHVDDFFGATLIGIVLCLLYIRTRSLFVPILVHMSYNAMSTFFATSVGMDLMESLDQFPEMIVAICSLVLAIQSLTILGWFFVYFWPRQSTLLPYEAAQTPITNKSV